MLRSFRAAAALVLPIVLVSSALVPPALAQARPAEVRPWEHETSDVAVSPRIRFGHLPNGMRFAWMANVEPKDRSYLRLHVDVGSLAEEESERGMAHYLEHMVFNGTRSFPAGTLVEWFQKHGMAFGADTNASTSFSETIYQIDLPRTDAATLAEGLKVLRDFADGALLEAKEVAAERGIIDAEERERDSAQFRAQIEGLRKKLDGTRVPSRLPIGAKEARDGFTPESVRAFYEKWYRPENTTLVLVGDLGDLDPEPLVREAFASFAGAAGKAAKQPPLGELSDAFPVFVVKEPEIPVVIMEIDQVTPGVERPVTAKSVRERLPLDMARAMLNLRLAEIRKKQGAPFLNASALDLRQLAEGLGVPVIAGEGLVVVATPDNWEKALDRADRELRRAVEHGFDAEELVEVRANEIRQLEEAAEREATRSSVAWVSEITSAAGRRVVVADAATRRALLKPALEAMKAEDCHRALAEAWGQGELRVSMIGNVPLGEGADAALSAALAASRAKTVSPRAAMEAKPFAYPSDAAKAGAIASRKHDDALDADRVEFANGVRLFVKKTDFRDRQILWMAQLGEGELAFDAKDRALSMAGPEVFIRGGLGAHDDDAIRRLMAGRQASVVFDSVDDRFVFQGSTTKDDLLLGFELATAYMADPGWRPDGLTRFAEQIPLLFESLRHQPEGPLMQQFRPEFASGDVRTSFPTREELESITMERIRAWLEPQLATGALDLTVVGDLDVEAVVQAAARTFGALPVRAAVRPMDERRTPVVLRTGLERTYEIDSKVPRSLVSIYFPTPDGRETEARRKFDVLASLLSDRLRVDVREKLGASYSPGARAELSQTFPGDGFVQVMAQAEPGVEKALVEACLAAADGLATEGVQEDELARVKEPMLAAIKDSRRTNEYWVNALARIHRDETAVEDIHSQVSFHEKLAPADLTPLAKRWLGRARASFAVVTAAKPSVPASAPAKGAPVPAGSGDGR